MIVFLGIGFGGEVRSGGWGRGGIVEVGGRGWIDWGGGFCGESGFLD